MKNYLHIISSLFFCVNLNMLLKVSVFIPFMMHTVDYESMRLLLEMLLFRKKLKIIIQFVIAYDPHTILLKS